MPIEVTALEFAAAVAMDDHKGNHIAMHTFDARTEHTTDCYAIRWACEKEFLPMVQ